MIMNIDDLLFKIANNLCHSQEDIRFDSLLCILYKLFLLNDMALLHVQQVRFNLQ